VFAYQKKQQAEFFLKDLVPLPAIGRAYVWRAGTGVEHRRAPSTPVVSKNVVDPLDFAPAFSNFGATSRARLSTMSIHQDFARSSKSKVLISHHCEHTG
jgi:hypothetical protein